MMSIAASVPSSTAARFRSRLPSPLPGVSAEAWARFVAALDVQPIRAVSASGGFGSYDMRPRRLQELGYVRNLRVTHTPAGRQVYACDWVPPLTAERFLGDLAVQYRVLVRSVTLHHGQIADGKIKRPEDVSLAGVLAILHRGGTGALRDWPDLFSDTRDLLERAQGAF